MEHLVASAELDQLGAQRQLQERLSLMQTVRLHHSAISEPSEKRVRVSEERSCAAVGQRLPLPGVQNDQLQMRSVRARRRGTGCLMVHTRRTPRDAKVDIGCMLWSGRADECEPWTDSDFCTICVRICTCLRE